MKIQGRAARIDPRTMTAEFTRPSKSGITLRLDDSTNPEAWLEITLTKAELLGAARRIEGDPTEEEIQAALRFGKQFGG